MGTHESSSGTPTGDDLEDELLLRRARARIDADDGFRMTLAEAAERFGIDLDDP